MLNKIIKGDALEELKNLENDSIDLICTDPPYGYSFMGKDWDKAVPSVEIWQECLRVLKPGAFCFVMSAPRSDVQSQMVHRLTEAGFRLDFTPIYWTYASGFPKAGNIGRLVDKRLGATTHRGTAFRTAGAGARADIQGKNGVAGMDKTETITPQAKALDGSYAGFQPKPAVEVIIVAMKPLSEKTFVDQALKNGKGITWLDDCRVPTDESLNGGTYSGQRRDIENTEWQNTDRKDGRGSGFRRGVGEFIQPQGRFPANLLVSDDVLNDGVDRPSPTTKGLTTGKSKFFGDEYHQEYKSGYADNGSYSRYFDLDKWASTLPFLIVPKASKSEKNKGLEHLPTKGKAYDYGSIKKSEGRHGENTARANHHPTVKPLKLMSYLITLGSRKGDVVLDPFVGSGTTCLAAKKLERKYIGIDREEEYVEISEARLKQEVQATLL